MANKAKELKYLATPEKEETSALAVRPKKRQAPARLRPRGQYEHASRQRSDHCQTVGCGLEEIGKGTRWGYPPQQESRLGRLGNRPGRPKSDVEDLARRFRRELSY